MSDEVCDRCRWSFDRTGLEFKSQHVKCQQTFCACLPAVFFSCANNRANDMIDYFDSLWLEEIDCRLTGFLAHWNSEWRFVSTFTIENLSEWEYSIDEKSSFKSSKIPFTNRKKQILCFVTCRYHYTTYQVNLYTKQKIHSTNSQNSNSYKRKSNNTTN